MCKRDKHKELREFVIHQIAILDKIINKFSKRMNEEKVVTMRTTLMLVRDNILRDYKKVIGRRK